VTVPQMVDQADRRLAQLGHRVLGGVAANAFAGAAGECGGGTQCGHRKD
jgi:hypothetical protein